MHVDKENPQKSNQTTKIPIHTHKKTNPQKIPKEPRAINLPGEIIHPYFSQMFYRWVTIRQQ